MNVNVQKVRINAVNANSNYRSKKATSFTATPTQICESLKTANLCPGKTYFIKNIAEFFSEIETKLKYGKTQGKPIEFNYKLGEKNQIPSNLVNISIDGVTLKQMDEQLNKNSFQCSPSNTKCSCGNELTKGEFVKKLLNIIGVENPDVITISA